MLIETVMNDGMVVETVMVLMITVFVVLMRNFEITLNNIGISRWMMELVVVVAASWVYDVVVEKDVYPD